MRSQQLLATCRKKKMDKFNMLFGMMSAYKSGSDQEDPPENDYCAALTPQWDRYRDQDRNNAGLNSSNQRDNNREIGQNEKERIAQELCNERYSKSSD